MRSLAENLLDKFGPTMTPLDVAAVLHQSKSHIRALCASGELPAVRIGSRWHIPTAKFAAMIEREQTSD